MCCPVFQTSRFSCWERNFSISLALLGASIILRAVYPKGKLEFKFLLSPEEIFLHVVLNTTVQYCNKRANNAAY